MENSLSILFILGMHRGGTSAAARLVNILGADIGRELLDAQPDINAEGFWENRHVVALHEEFLKKTGSAWFDTRPPTRERERAGAMEPFLEGIRKVLRNQYPALGLVAVKDPRLCRLLPLWRAALDTDPTSLGCLLVLRRPAEVVRSILRRDGFDEDTALLLWLVHMLEAEFHSRGLPRVAVLYDDILENWAAAARRIADKIGIAWPTPIENAGTRVAADIRADLRRHHLPDTRTENASGLQATARKVFDMLNSGEPDNHRADLDRIRNALEKDAAGCGMRSDMLFRNTRLLAEANQRLTELGRMHGHALEVIAERDRQLDEANRHREDLGRMHGRALEVIAERDRQVEELGELHRHAIEEIEEKERLVARIRSHWAWPVAKWFIGR